MRIAYLTNRYPAVSHSFIRCEILALERQGVEVVRVALRGWDAELPDPNDESERERTHYVLKSGAVPLLLALGRMAVTRPMRFARALQLAWRMSRRADRPLPIHLIYLAEACAIEPRLRSADVEHLHAHFGTNSAEVAMLVRELGGPPWSFTVHGPEEFDKAPTIGLAEKLRRCSFAVAVSSYGRSQLYRLVAEKYWAKIHVVHCGIDPAFFADASEVTPEPNRLVCIGRLGEQKGQLLLVEAARRLATQGVDFQLVLAGDGDMRAELETLIAAHGLQDMVRITGWISGARVREELLAARGLVLPSFAEGLPVAIMEAMALRRPVISTYIAGIPELIRPGEHGWLVPAGDVEALVQAMRECLAAPTNVLIRMGESARRRVLERHDADKSASMLKDLFQKQELRSGVRCKTSSGKAKW